MKNLIKLLLVLIPISLIGCFSEIIELDKDSNSYGVIPKTLNIPSNLKYYYRDLTGTTDRVKLKKELKRIISKYRNIKYQKRHKYLYNADANLNNPREVILVYSGKSINRNQHVSGKNHHRPQTFNTEHIYPKSLLKKQRRYKAISDLHHLRSCDIKINNKRGNKPFADGTGKFKNLGKAWFPGDEWKGDVARMVFYLNVMHGLDINKVGSKELFIKWNIEDPVSDFEKQRNNTIQRVQKNRNPFIDNPYFVTLIYGGEKAENTWK